jgi:hypothetical protein
MSFPTTPRNAGSCPNCKDNIRADGSPLLRELKREAPSLVDYITSENCPLAASLTNGEKKMLLAIKQAAAQDSAPPPASQKDK